jgi:hypothetical protein
MRSSKRVVASDNNCISIIEQNAAIDVAVDQLIRIADSNNGRLPHQAMGNAILGLSMLGIKVERNFRNHRKRIRMLSERPLLAIDIANSSVASSDITMSTGQNSTHTSTSRNIAANGSQHCSSSRGQNTAASVYA